MFCRRSIFGRLSQICEAHNLDRGSILVVGEAAAVFYNLCQCASKITLAVPKEMAERLKDSDIRAMRNVEVRSVDSIPENVRRHRKFNIISKEELLT